MTIFICPFILMHDPMLCSCLIARNLLFGLKTCIEVSSYMCDGGASTLHRSIVTSSFLEENGKSETDYMVCTRTLISLYFLLHGLSLIKGWKKKVFNLHNSLEAISVILLPLQATIASTPYNTSFYVWMLFNWKKNHYKIILWIF